MEHAHKPYFVFRRNRRVHLNRLRGRQLGRLLAAEVCAISSSNAGYTMFRGSVKGTGYPLHSPYSLHFPSCALPCAITFHFKRRLLHVPNYKGPSSENKYQHFLLFKPTNEQHIYINNMLYTVSTATCFDAYTSSSGNLNFVFC